MGLIWIQRLILIVLLALGGVFSLENRHPVLVHIGGQSYETPAYMLIIIVLAFGFVGGALLARLSTLVDVKKKQPKD